MQIADVQVSDELELGEMMIRVIKSSVRADEAEKAAFIQNVRTNLRLSFDVPQNCVHLKCVDDECIVGVILIRDFWNLCSLFVDPDYHGSGIGRKLIDEGVNRCALRNEKPDIRVNAAANAIGFYKAMGFEVLNDHPRRGSTTPMSYVIRI